MLLCVIIAVSGHFFANTFMNDKKKFERKIKIMDFYSEKLVYIKKTPLQKFTKFMVIFGAVVLILICAAIVVFQLLGFLSVFAALIALGIGYGAYFLSGNFDIEYEYIITNEFFDIDVIKGRRIRKRVISTECKNFEELGKYSNEKFAHSKFDTRIVAANLDSDSLYYVITNKGGFGRTLIVFDADEKALNILRRFSPRQVISNDLFRN